MKCEKQKFNAEVWGFPYDSDVTETALIANEFTMWAHILYFCQVGRRNEAINLG